MSISSSIYSLVGGTVVVPSDTVAVTDCRAIYVGGSGDVAVRMMADQTVLVFRGVLGGTILPIQVDRIMATSTTATFMLALR